MQRLLKERVHKPTLAYTVRHRHDPELVGPAAQTPREIKRLSDLDNSLRSYMALLFFYRGREDVFDPAGVIRGALGGALVHYYPLAGRLREIEGGKLVVDCTGEGVLFVQADADVQLADLEAAGLRPPFPCLEQLLLDVEGSSGVLNCPLMLIQVTRMLCGGIVLAVRFNHAICDGIGIAQFMNAVAEVARGLSCITVTPVWSRELIELETPTPATPWTFPHHPPAPPHPLPPVAVGGDMVMRSFIFSASDVVAIKRSLHVTANTFEALAAFIWRARTAALEVPPGEDATLAISANFRSAVGLPAGYYGNASPPTTVEVNAAALRDGSLGDAVALVRRAKAAVTSQNFRSIIDAHIARQWLVPPNLFIISDVRRMGFERVDFGWGEPVFAGPPDAVFSLSFFITCAEDGVAVLMELPQRAMDRFTAEVESKQSRCINSYDYSD